MLPTRLAFLYFLASISHNFSCNEENKRGKRITTLFPFSEASSSGALSDFCSLNFLIYSCTLAATSSILLRGDCSWTQLIILNVKSEIEEIKVEDSTRKLDTFLGLVWWLSLLIWWMACGLREQHALKWAQLRTLRYMC